MQLPFTLRMLNKDVKFTLISVCVSVCVQTVMYVYVHVNSFSRFGGRSTKMSDSFPVHTPHTVDAHFCTTSNFRHCNPHCTPKPLVSGPRGGEGHNCTTPITLAQLLFTSPINPL